MNSSHTLSSPSSFDIPNPNKPFTVLLTFTSLSDSEVIRRITLTNDKPSIDVKRGSENTAKSLVPAADNLILQSTVVSRHHARITVVPQTEILAIQDLDSTHGTWISGRRIPSQTKIPLSPQLVITFGADVGHGKVVHTALGFKVDYTFLPTPGVAKSPGFTVPDSGDDSSVCDIEVEPAMSDMANKDIGSIDIEDATTRVLSEQAETNRQTGPVRSRTFSVPSYAAESSGDENDGEVERVLHGIDSIRESTPRPGFVQASDLSPTVTEESADIDTPTNDTNEVLAFLVQRETVASSLNAADQARQSKPKLKRKADESDMVSDSSTAECHQIGKQPAKTVKVEGATVTDSDYTSSCDSDDSLQDAQPRDLFPASTTDTASASKVSEAATPAAHETSLLQLQMKSQLPPRQTIQSSPQPQQTQTDTLAASSTSQDQHRSKRARHTNQDVQSRGLLKFASGVIVGAVGMLATLIVTAPADVREEAMREFANV